MIKENIKIGHSIDDLAEAVYIYARFTVIESIESEEEIKEFYSRTRRFSEYLSNNFDFKVTSSVLPEMAIEYPDSNCWGIEIMTIIPLSENYQELEQSLKSLILSNYSKFY